MPTYEYLCPDCGERFERFQKMSDPPVKSCPSCGAGVRKVMHPPAIAFKGSGFHINDYASSSRSRVNSSSSNGESESKPAPVAETKPEAKATESKPEPATSAPAK
ncbi:MAG: zinc ribbon domain-containing protein [Armatimonadetes bacterium]|jgi:putative FmdB family regulatory protein|nr:zinc ribbon domain-containing protein [Armatimonadota bacterium]HOC31637.1 zinc ribbon domain-containing protein [Armatimonadota bacterium]